MPLLLPPAIQLLYIVFGAVTVVLLLVIVGLIILIVKIWKVKSMEKRDKNPLYEVADTKKLYPRLT